MILDSLGYNKRRSWSENEQSLILQNFGEHINSGILPSSEILANLIKKSPVLKNRNELQLKSWISNRIQRRKRHDAVQKRHRGKYMAMQKVAGHLCF